MSGIWVNAGAILFGGLLGAGFKHVLSARYLDALWVALGLAALGIGASSVVNNLPKSHYPLLFVVSLALGLPLGAGLDLDDHLNHWLDHHFKSQLGTAIATSIFLDCIGVMAILGPVNAATNGNQTLLYTNAMFVFVSTLIFGASVGVGIILVLPVVCAWLSIIYFVAKYLSASFFSPALITELSIIGGLLILAAALSILKIRDFKSLNMLPALLVPILFFIGLHLF